MIQGIQLIILGRQGAGKGTQCGWLSNHYVVPHISTGDILRAAVKEGTTLGKLAKEIMDAGGLVGDDVMIGIIEERLNRPDAARRGYILDGFPRTVAQAEALGAMREKGPDVVVDLDVPRELVIERISARRVCRDCGSNYTAMAAEAAREICERCGGDIVLRDDDTPEAINQRLDLYESQTAPLLEYYDDRGLLAVVNGVGPPNRVFERLVTTIDSARRPHP